MNSNSQLETNTSIKKLNYRDLIIFIVPVLIFALYLFIFNPGILTVNSYSILHQIASGEFVGPYSIFYTFIVMVCLKIYPSAATVGVLQILIFAIIWTAICKYHRDDTLNTSNQFVMQFALTLIITLIPINAVYSITLQENVLFAYALLTLTFLIKILIDRNGQLNLKMIILLALALALTSQLTRYGIIISIITLICLALYLLKKNNSQNKVLRLAAATIVIILILSSLNVVFNVHDSNEKLIESNGINLEKSKYDFFSGINENPSASYESATSINQGSDKYTSMNGFVSAFSNNPILGTLFENPITYLVLSLLALAFIFMATPSRELILIYVPNLFNIIFAVISSPIQIKLYSNLLIFYLIAVILISIYFRQGVNLKDNSLNKKTQSEVNFQEIPKQNYVEEPQEYYYNSIEEELEALTPEDIDEMLGKTHQEEPTTHMRDKTSPNDNSNPDIKDKTSPNDESSSDLIDEILKEIESGKK